MGETELDLIQLEKEIMDVFINVHGIGNLILKNTSRTESMPLFGSVKRPVIGWYCKSTLRVAFYFNPTFIDKQKMYWIHGWSWEANGKT